MSRKFIAVVAAGALAAVPAVAAAKPPAQKPQPQNQSQTHGKSHAKAVAYTFKGTFVSWDQGANTITVAIPDQHGATNKAGRSFRGQTVTFSLANSKLKLSRITDGADAGTDVSLADALTTDVVKVQSKLPKHTTFTSGTTYATKHVLVQRPDTKPDAPDSSTTS